MGAVEVHHDDEDGQESNWMNGTLQGAGPDTAVTIQTHATGIAGTPAEVENGLTEPLTKASQATDGTLTFTLIVGDPTATR